jgi:hypothetical protein
MYIGRSRKTSSLKLSWLQPCESVTAKQKGIEILNGEESNWEILLQVQNPRKFLRGSSSRRSAAAVSAGPVRRDYGWNE